MPTGRSCYVSAIRQELIARNASYASLTADRMVSRYRAVPCCAGREPMSAVHPIFAGLTQFYLVGCKFVLSVVRFDLILRPLQALV